MTDVASEIPRHQSRFSASSMRSEQCSFKDFSLCVIASESAKLVANIQKPSDVAEQTVTPALVTYLEGIKIYICGSLLLFIQCIC